MRKSIIMQFKFLFICLLINVTSKAQVPYFDWAIKGETSGGAAFAANVARDNSGNLYATGIFTETLTLGATTLVNTPGFFSADIYLCRFDTLGNIMWAVSAGGPDFDVVRAIDCDDSGNIYITGRFADYAVFGTHTIISNGEEDFYIAKYDSQGNCIWVKSGGGIYYDDGISLLYDDNGFIYSHGTFQEFAIFDNDTLESTLGFGHFLIKYDTLGNQQWAKKIMSQIDAGITTNIVKSNNSIYLAGSVYNTILVNNSPVITTNNNADIYIINFDTSGNYLWSVKNTNSVGVEYPEKLAIDSNNNLYLTGWFTANTNFDTINLINSGSNDMFIAKINPAGQTIWAKKAGSSENNEGKSVIVDNDGNVYVAGIINGLVDFDQIQINAPIGNSMNDIFVAKYDSSGFINWVKHVGSSNSVDFANDIMLVNDNLYLHGRYESTINFDNNILTNNNPYFNVYLSKLSNLTTNLSENSNESLFTLFPNPSQGQFLIYIEGPDEKLLTVHDIKGKIIYESVITEGELSKSVSINSPSGIYFLTIKSGSNIFIKKMIIQR